MPRYMIEGAKDGELFAEAIDAPDMEAATEKAIWRLCEAWRENTVEIEELSDLGDAASVREFEPEDYAREAAQDMLEALRATQSFPWVHNAAITNDIEALRRICLAYAWWNNSVLLPLLERIERPQ
jgi:hypothetical protein